MTGRPTDYQPEFAAQAKQLCELGATDAELAEFFEVSVRTVYRWQNAHKAFSQALKTGKSAADERVERSLYGRAVGYRYTEQQAIKVKTGHDTEEIEIVEVEREVPPDPVSCIFWLKNRRPEQWREKPSHTIGSADLTTEQGILEALRKVTARLLEGKLPIEHAKGIAILLGAILQAERGAMEGKVAQALAQLQGIIEGKAPAQLAPGGDKGATPDSNGGDSA